MPQDETPLSRVVISKGVSAPIIKRHRIIREDVVKVGYTAGCIGCRCIGRGVLAQGHNGICRSRMRSELEKEEDIRLGRSPVMVAAGIFLLRWFCFGFLAVFPQP